ncbi:MAG: GNAT family protein [Devosia sp.]|nr:GNAT family protein [Devosia sp.]
MAFEPRYPIETKRLRLRPFNRGDVDAVFAYRKREDVARHLFDGPMTHQTATEVVGLRAGQFTLAAEGDKMFLAVDLADPHAMIGEVSLIWRDAVSRQGEIGYIFNPLHHGHGYATEATRVLLGLGFEDLGLHRIYARCAAANTASWHVMERLGMRREAHFREHAFFKGGWDEELVYAILEDEWRAMQPG